MNNKIIEILEKKIKIQKEFDFETTFPPLGHPEHHFNKYPNHPWLKFDFNPWGLTNVEVINKWVAENACFYNLRDWEVCEDLTVKVTDGNFVLVNKDTKFIPVQFRSSFKFTVGNSDLRSLIGSPYVVDNLDASNAGIKDFQGLTNNLTGSLNLNKNKILSLKGMPNFKYRLLNMELSNNFISKEDFFFKIKVNSLNLTDNNIKAEDIEDLLKHSDVNTVFIYNGNQNSINMRKNDCSKVEKRFI